MFSFFGNNKDNGKKEDYNKNDGNKAKENGIENNIDENKKENMVDENKLGQALQTPKSDSTQDFGRVGAGDTSVEAKDSPKPLEKDVPLGSSCDDYVFSEKNKRYVVGEVAGTFYQVPYIAKKSNEKDFHRNDIVADVAKMGNLLVMGATLRGESHYAHEIPRQDNFLFEECIVDDDHSFVIASIADGVGNAKKADAFSEMLVNFLNFTISQELSSQPDIELLDWNSISEQIWNVAIRYCYQKSGSKDIDSYFENWASTLECIVVETGNKDENRFATATISGDGGMYKIDAECKWHVIKQGKTGNNGAVSNMVYCLPDKPINIITNKGSLRKGEAIFITTDGLSDYIEEYPDVRMFFGDNLPRTANLPEFIRVLNVAIKQMDDDKTGILVQFFDTGD